MTKHNNDLNTRLRASPCQHEWDVSPKQAVQIQHSLREHLCMHDDLDTVNRIAGLDIGFEQNGKITRAAVAVLDPGSLALMETAVARVPTTFPYVPGLLSFRELPGALEALKLLSELPDLILCDGQGYAHPRRMGIACHLGLLTNIPTLGVGKSRLVGQHDMPGHRKGDRAVLIHKGEVVGCVLRTRDNVSPVYISPGHRLSLATAVEYVLAATPRYRLPETTRHAHKLASG